MSQSSWLVAGMLPGIERQPRKKLEHRILSINLVLRLEVVRIGGGPMAIQSRSNLSVFHIKSP
jgi:hypothetical protein